MTIRCFESCANRKEIPSSNPYHNIGIDLCIISLALWLDSETLLMFHAM